VNTTTTIYDNRGWWLALAIVTTGLAELKGRRRWVWFVLGLLLGPIATALVVVWAPSGCLTEVGHERTPTAQAATETSAS
jgi:hypothetical protein